MAEQDGNTETGPFNDNPAAVDPASFSRMNSVVITDHPDVREIPVTLIGYRLARIILTIIGAYIIFLILYLLVTKDTSDVQLTSQVNYSDSAAFSNKLELLKTVQLEQKHQRDFIVQISQMVLLNLLLPILTAILGYIFGSNKHQSSGD